MISETTTAITGWDDSPTPQPIFKFSLHGTEPIYIPTWRRKAQKNACCASFQQLSIKFKWKNPDDGIVYGETHLKMGAMNHLQKSLIWI